ncbi:hypothetical protein G6F36_015524 [Rhizopus arrhizus]|nr:hypothetical protein G6F36_015524 [Rhizopus arrhizus]
MASQESLEVEAAKESIDFPKRPYWDYDMSKEEVERHEEESFERWMRGIEETYGGEERLGWFERNLEVWRQLYVARSTEKERANSNLWY